MKTRECLNRIIVYRPGKPISEVKRELGVERIVKLASNENPLGPSPQAVQAMKDCADQVNLYPDGNGYYLKEKIAEKCRISPDSVILGNGSDEIIRLLTQSYVNPSDEVINGDYSFITYRIATDLVDGKNVFVSFTNDLRTNLAATLEAITDKTRLIFIDNPNNPTGTIVKSDEVADFLDKVPEEIIVVFDEAYFEYIDDETYPDTLTYLRNGKKNLVILRTFSKIYGLAGLRIGYGMASPTIIENLNKVRCPFNTNSLAQEAALVSLDDKLQITRSVANNEVGKAYLYNELGRQGVEVTPSYGNFVLAKVPGPGKDFFEKLLKKGIIVRPLAGYGLNNYLRITIGRVDENEIFVQSLKEII